jgi:hypothetical protein
VEVSIELGPRLFPSSIVELTKVEKVTGDTTFSTTQSTRVVSYRMQVVRSLQVTRVSVAKHPEFDPLGVDLESTLLK